MTDITVIIPAYNEAKRLRAPVQELTETYDVLVVDDGSADQTAAAAQAAGASIIQHSQNRGYIAALKHGFRAATGEILVTFDADGEHQPRDVSRLISPIKNGQADLVLGARRTIPRPSERLLNALARVRVPVRDSGTGLRALRRDLAIELELDTACTCGTFVLEAALHGAQIGEVPIETQSIEKPRGVAWQHSRQVFHVAEYMLRTRHTNTKMAESAESSN